MNILLLVFLSFVVRLAFSYLPSFEVDMNTWLAWALRLNEVGVSKFYSDQVWTSYTPGYLYWLWLIGSLGWVNELAIKIPVVLADILTGLFIYLILEKKSRKFAAFSLVAYVLNPMAIFNGSIWGQIDAIFALFLFASSYFLIEKRKSLLSSIFWAAAFLIKPQAVAFLPVVVLIMFYKKFSLKEVASYVLGPALFVLLLSWPFFPKNPVQGLVDLVIKMAGHYPYTSIFAFNLWSLVGMWKPDSNSFLGLSYFWWGISLYLASLSLIVLKFRGRLNRKRNFYLLFSLSFLSFFLFPTRIHERYLFPFFAFFLTFVGLSKSYKMLKVYFLSSFLFLINLYHPYAYYNENFLKIENLLKITEVLSKPVGLAFLALFFLLVHSNEVKKTGNEFSKEKFPGPAISPKKTKILMGLVLAFALITRVAWLGNPDKEYFDEVYHAFTARRILHADIKAWEWWSKPPQGFAYEWTHPPLAKLGMVLGMRVFGENPFGWRIPGALLGVGSVLLVFGIAKILFKDDAVAIISSGIFALDGLPLVMSRIGMNDSYLLFFLLLCLYLFLGQKYLWSSLAFGLALSSKWSGIWMVPILGLILINKFVSCEIRQFQSSYKKDMHVHPNLVKVFFYFLILPPVIYLASYTPMFLSGHGLGAFWEMQKQMWWYHTSLSATHPYSSSWWSWPLLFRPIYLYTGDETGGWVARIYAMGNPLVFWGGLVGIAILIIKLVTLRISRFVSINPPGLWSRFTPRVRALILVLFSYFAFFSPWMFSPRVMFIYHYLPSLPFMAIALAFILRRNKTLTRYYLLLATLVFLYFYPHWAGLKVPPWLDSSYYWFSSWR